MAPDEIRVVLGKADTQDLRCRLQLIPRSAAAAVNAAAMSSGSSVLDIVSTVGRVCDGVTGDLARSATDSRGQRLLSTSIAALLSTTQRRRLANQRFRPTIVKSGSPVASTAGVDARNRWIYQPLFCRCSSSTLEHSLYSCQLRVACMTVSKSSNGIDDFTLSIS